MAGRCPNSVRTLSVGLFLLLCGCSSGLVFYSPQEMSPQHMLERADLVRAASADNLLKADPNDPKHPGYPKGAPDGRGGQFRPKDGAGAAPGRRGGQVGAEDESAASSPTVQASEMVERDVGRAAGREAVRKAAKVAIARFLEMRAARRAL